jgi:hypothetical protein
VERGHLVLPDPIVPELQAALAPSPPTRYGDPSAACPSPRCTEPSRGLSAFGPAPARRVTARAGIFIRWMGRPRQKGERSGFALPKPQGVGKPTRPCIFCGRAARRSNEHVVPLWLQDWLGIKQSEFVSRENIFETQGPVFPGEPLPSMSSKIHRSHAHKSLVYGSVCRSCNNGWMSRLEDAVRPTLFGLIPKDRSL